MGNKTIIRLNEHSPNHAEWITVNELGRQVTEPESSTLNNFPDEYTNLFTKDLQCEFLGKLPYKDIRSQNPSRYVVTCEVGTYNCKEVA